jgi:hypothetical protein
MSNSTLMSSWMEKKAVGTISGNFDSIGVGGKVETLESNLRFGHFRFATKSKMIK